MEQRRCDKNMMSLDEKREKQKQVTYQKIMNMETLGSNELARILNVSNDTIHIWENLGVVPKARRNEKNHRIYPIEDLEKFLESLITYPRERQFRDIDSIKAVWNYVKIALDIQRTKRSVSEPYAFKGDKYGRNDT